MNNLSETRIALVGVGALGSAVLERLADSGMRSVLLIDPDRLEQRNMALSPVFQRAVDFPRSGDRLDAGLPPFKAELLASYLSLTAGLSVCPVTCEVADVGWQDLSNTDLIVCCTDSALSRVETAFAARMLRKPMIDGAVFGDGIPEGRVSCYSPWPDAACYLCNMSEESRSMVLGHAASSDLGCRVPESVPAMTGTMNALRMTAETVRSKCSTRDLETLETSSAVRLLAGEDHAEIEETRLVPLELSSSASCPWHDRTLPCLVPLPWEEALQTSLRTVSAGSITPELQFAWPICTEAVCSVCAVPSQPYLRVARVRRMQCGNCGAAKLQPRRVVHRVRATDDISERSPRQLGQPDRHLYWLRHFTAMNGFSKDAA